MKRVLFLCTGNSARSQMAEALLPSIAPGSFEAYSAGTHPTCLNPCAVTVLRELGLDIAGRRSKHIDEFRGRTFDYVITVCDRAKESCPVLPGAGRVLHWSFDDPAAADEQERVAVFRRVRDEIAEAICQFLMQEERMPSTSLRCECSVRHPRV